MEEATNPRAIDFEDWAAPALERGEPRWLLRRVAVECTHISENNAPITA